MNIEQYKFIPNWNNKDVSDIKNWHLLALPVKYYGINCIKYYLVYKSPALIRKYSSCIVDISMYNSLNDLFKAGYIVNYITTEENI